MRFSCKTIILFSLQALLLAACHKVETVQQPDQLSSSFISVNSSSSVSSSISSSFELIENPPRTESDLGGPEISSFTNEPLSVNFNDLSVIIRKKKVPIIETALYETIDVAQMIASSKPNDCSVIHESADFYKKMSDLYQKQNVNAFIYRINSKASINSKYNNGQELEYAEFIVYPNLIHETDAKKALFDFTDVGCNNPYNPIPDYSLALNSKWFAYGSTFCNSFDYLDQELCKKINDAFKTTLVLR